MYQQMIERFNKDCTIFNMENNKYSDTIKVVFKFYLEELNVSQYNYDTISYSAFLEIYQQVIGKTKGFMRGLLKHFTTDIIEDICMYIEQGIKAYCDDEKVKEFSTKHIEKLSKVEPYNGNMPKEAQETIKVLVEIVCSKYINATYEDVYFELTTFFNDFAHFDSEYHKFFGYLIMEYILIGEKNG